MIRFSPLLLLSLILGSSTTWADNGELIISGWGGAYEQAQAISYFQPFEEEHDVRIKIRPYNGGIGPLDFLEHPGDPGWDVLDMTESDALAACNERLLKEFDKSVLISAPDGTAATKDFFDGAIFKCGVAHVSYADVIAYDDRAFPNVKPNSVADFFDIERFPGKRALPRRPIAILEWAMLSYNVPVSQIYDLLSTERGFKLVSERLNQLKGNIVWWEQGHEPVDLLSNGEVAMASGFNGRFDDARVNHDIPITIIPDGQFVQLSVWGIHRQAQRPDLAAQFIAFATRTDKMAALSNILSYGPTRKSALDRIYYYAGTMPLITDNYSNAELGVNRRIRADSHWYSATETIRHQWFDEWLNSIGE